MGAVVVLVVAIAIMLALAVVVGALRLRTAVRGLRDVVRSTQEWVQPALTELTEASQVTSLEAAQLQASIADLGASRGSSGRPGSGDVGGYTA